MSEHDAAVLRCAAAAIDRLPVVTARLAEAEALLREARERETRYVLPLYRDANYTARIDAFLGDKT